MAKAITNIQLSKLAKMIRDWPDKEAITWENICTASRSIIGYKPSRQALSAKIILKNAYHTKKKQRKDAAATAADIRCPQSMLDAINKITRLQQENHALRVELEKMAEVAQRFIYNASIAGISQQRLMMPLPKVRRN